MKMHFPANFQVRENAWKHRKNAHFSTCISLTNKVLCFMLYALGCITLAPHIDPKDIYSAVDTSSMIFDDEGLVEARFAVLPRVSGIVTGIRVVDRKAVRHAPVVRDIRGRAILSGRTGVHTK